MEIEYDEDVRQNRFFQEIRKKCESIKERGTNESWIVCVPRRGTFVESVLSDEEVTGHILVPCQELESSSDFRTLDGKDVKLLADRTVLVSKGLTEICSSYLLFEETFYEDDLSKYRVWCVERPLEVGSVGNASTRLINVTNIREAVTFLWTETSEKKLLKDFTSVIEAFEYTQPDLEDKSIQEQKDLVHGLYDASLHLLLKDPRLQTFSSRSEHFYKNLQLSVETFLLYSLRDTLSRSISACTADADAGLNKILRNSYELDLADLRVRRDLYESVHVAIIKLSHLDRFATVVEKAECLKRTVRCLSPEVSPISSDDLLPVLVFLVVRTGLPNWIAQLTFMKEFRFSLPFANAADEVSFLITSLEAAVEYLRNGTVKISRRRRRRKLRQRNSISTPGHLFAAIKRGNLFKVRTILLEEQRATSITPPLCHPLCICESCEAKRIRRDSSCRATVCSRDEKGFSALHLAVLYDRTSIAKFLLVCDPDAVNLADEHTGRTALHWAAVKGYRNILSTLLNANADPQMVDLQRNTALHLSAEHGHDDCVEALLRFHNDGQKSQLDCNVVNLNGDTPLFRASKWGYRGIVKLLLKYGASPMIRNKRGETPVTVAHSKCVLDLLISDKAIGSEPSGALTADLDFGNASKIAKNTLHSRDVKTDHDMDKLFTAIAEGDTCLACYYLGLENRHNKIPKRMNDMCHPLCDCERCSTHEEPQTDTTDCGKERGRALGVNAQNRAGESALHVASAVGSTVMVRILLDAGANVNATTEYERRTPLHLACLCDNVDVLELLLNCATCDLDAKDRNGNTPLHYAVKTADPKLVKLLVRYGASTQLRNFRGVTPLRQLQEEVSENAVSLPLIDISNILKRNYYENTRY